MPIFQRYFGIDYSGAATANHSLKGLRVYAAMDGELPIEILPPRGAKKYWNRRGIAQWLVAELLDGAPTFVGIDHAFSFPSRYFEEHQLSCHWSDFLDDFQAHWPTDRDNISVENIRQGVAGNGAERMGNARWRRLTEKRCRAKSVFHFDVQGSVAKSTHSGLPWLRYLRRQLGKRVHFWPFDGWNPPSGSSVIAEVYPALSNKIFPPDDRSPDQHDAYSVARWLQECDLTDELPAFFSPSLSDEERATCLWEGWIFGIG
jgi:hypothetical protein